MTPWYELEKGALLLADASVAGVCGLLSRAQAGFYSLLSPSAGALVQCATRATVHSGGPGFYLPMKTFKPLFYYPFFYSIPKNGDIPNSGQII